MNKLLFFGALFIIVSLPALGQVQDSSSAYVIRHENALGKDMPGPHDGKGVTTGYIFFDDIKTYPISFRKRVLHPGSSIGKHTQTEDEVYYVLSGSGVMYINGVPHALKPGDAILTCNGSTHETIQKGDQDLVLIIAFPKQ